MIKESVISLGWRTTPSLPWSDSIATTRAAIQSTWASWTPSGINTTTQMALVIAHKRDPTLNLWPMGRQLVRMLRFGKIRPNYFYAWQLRPVVLISHWLRKATAARKTISDLTRDSRAFFFQLTVWSVGFPKLTRAKKTFQLQLRIIQKAQLHLFVRDW